MMELFPIIYCPVSKA
ncbi:Protein of unknown function [Lactobacillus acidophilus DSM 9126]|nr:Protein of unknown function [Lactobacillus acidophilus DSM 20079 = JCM 1132 = NBRC 13951 = CIP 76.13]CDF68972.1 Protein of unknown function [Lactobacillus acidophilus CIRM-BIA 442]CDF70743.1 Protein of unknown function [Lactobacillus acidophilus CIRM-BIA 445]CDF72565.1 Protein of unknown function [Lactobacillus acidophilus DSM 9126]CDF74545.1 Protein of unknown function [Lactobacillus acidophilus DSM 20242]